MFVMGDFNLEATDDPWIYNWWYPLFAEGDRPDATPYNRRVTWIYRRVPVRNGDLHHRLWFPRLLHL